MTDGHREIIYNEPNEFLEKKETIRKILEQYKEPLLEDQSRESLRLSITDVLDEYKKIWRIEKHESSAIVVVTEVAQKTTEQIIRKDSFYIDNAIFEEFMTLMDDSCIWTMPLRDDRIGLDGSIWELELYNPDKNSCIDRSFKLVSRWSPKEGGFRNICKEISKLDTINRYAHAISIVSEYLDQRVSGSFLEERDTNTFLNAVFTMTGIKSSEAENQIKSFSINSITPSVNLIEIEFEESAMALFPWKRQIVFDHNLSFIYDFNSLKWQIIEVDKFNKSYLVLVNSTSKGNGSHMIYEIKENRIAPRYGSSRGGDLRTYDGHHDAMIFEPHELEVSFLDVNLDGVIDLSFSGTLLAIQGLSKYGNWYDVDSNTGEVFSKDNPFLEIPIYYHFLYDSILHEFIPANFDYYNDNYLDSLLLNEIEK